MVEVSGRPRTVTRQPFPTARRVVLAFEHAGRSMSPMHGLLDLDVGRARRLLAAHDPPLSFTAYVDACVARAAAAHPEVHAYRDWRGRLVLHGHVDVATIVEVATPQGPFPLAHLLRDADARSVADLSAELRAVKGDHTRTWSGGLLATLPRRLAHVPGLASALTLGARAAARSVRAHALTGTVTVTSVGMFGGGGGFGIAPPTLASLAVVVGGVSPRPRAAGDEVQVREVLDLTVTIDHDVVDGGPAARFGRDLRALLESACVLDAPRAAG